MSRWGWQQQYLSIFRMTHPALGNLIKTGHTKTTQEQCRASERPGRYWSSLFHFYWYRHYSTMSFDLLLSVASRSFARLLFFHAGCLLFLIPSSQPAILSHQPTCLSVYLFESVQRPPKLARISARGNELLLQLKCYPANINIIIVAKYNYIACIKMHAGQRRRRRGVVVGNSAADI